MKSKKQVKLLVGAGLLVLTLGAASASKYFSARIPSSRASLIRFKIQIHPNSTHQDLSRLAGWLNQNNFDVPGMNFQNKEIEVITSQAGLNFLQSKGLRGKVIENRISGSNPQEGVDPRYLNPDKVLAKLQALNKAYPQITRLETIGKSVQGRPIMALLISTTPDLKNRDYYEKPSVLFDGMHHAREVMTPEIVVDIAESLLLGAQRGFAQARRMVADMNIWVVPMMNVDGNSIVWSSDNWWRKNARAEGGSVHGVDVNRNYPHRWGQCNGSSGTKSSETYRGHAHGSEPETQAIIRLADAIQPIGYISYHSYSELVLYPYGCQGEYTPEKELIDKVGKELASLLPTDSGKGFYKPGTVWEVLYTVDGDAIGHMYSAHGALSYTLEVNQSFQPSYEIREPTLKKHRIAWQHFLKRLNQNTLRVTVVDAKTGRPVSAEIDIDTIKRTRGERAFKTNPNGHFFKVLDPGNYVVTAKLQDGRSKSVQVKMAGQRQGATISIP